jgi:hypothetical protein
MKRDMDLIRKILLEVEGSPSDKDFEDLKIDGYTDEEVEYHAWLLIDAKLAHGYVTLPDVGYPHPEVKCLSWSGHEFLDAARDDTRWKKVTRTLLEKGETVTIGVLQGLLVASMKSAVGLP